MGLIEKFKQAFAKKKPLVSDSKGEETPDVAEVIELSYEDDEKKDGDE